VLRVPAFFQCTFLLGTALDIALIALILWRGSVRPWTSLLVYAVGDLGFDVILWHGSPEVRYWARWIWFTGAALCRLWALHDVLRSFPGASFLRRHLAEFSFSAGSALAAMCLWFAFGDSHPRLSSGMAFAISLDQGVMVAWAAFMVVVLVTTRRLRLIWSRRGAMVCYGMLAWMLAGLAAAYLLPLSSNARTISGYLTASAACVNLLFWTSGFVLADGWYLRNTPPELEASFTNTSHAEKEGPCTT
jgi:hypothetical protein